MWRIVPASSPSTSRNGLPGELQASSTGESTIASKKGDFHITPSGEVLIVKSVVTSASRVVLERRREVEVMIKLEPPLKAVRIRNQYSRKGARLDLSRGYA